MEQNEQLQLATVTLEPCPETQKVLLKGILSVLPEENKGSLENIYEGG